MEPQTTTQSNTLINRITQILTALVAYGKEFFHWVIRTIVSSIALIVMIAVASSLLFGGNPTEHTRDIVIPSTSNGSIADTGEIVMLHLSGEIVEKATLSDPFSFDTQVISSQDLKQTLRDLKADDQVKAVILRINSPGGGVVASDEAYQAVRNFAQEKPIIASISETAASGGYYIAAGATKIVAHPSSMIGSIGVVGYFPNAAGLMEKVGVDMQVISTGNFKDAGSPYRAMNEQERAMIGTVIEDSLTDFKAAVAAGRNLSREEVDAIADARIVSGKGALELSLVDQLGGLEDAYTLAQSLANAADAPLTEEAAPSFFDSLFSVHGLVQIMAQHYVQTIGLETILQTTTVPALNQTSPSANTQVIAPRIEATMPNQATVMLQ